MAGESERRLALNEALYRELNERIEAGREPAAGDRRVAFLCECARLGCNTVLELDVREYERIRRDARRFAVAPGHANPGVEVVVGEGDGYLVVQKLGEGADVAEETDPRDGG